MLVPMIGWKSAKVGLTIMETIPLFFFTWRCRVAQCIQTEPATITYTYISWFHFRGQKHRTHMITQCDSSIETMPYAEKMVTVLLIVTTKISRSLGSSCQFPRRRTQHLRFSHQQWQGKGSLQNHGLKGLNSLEEWGDECSFMGVEAWSIEMDSLWVKY